jgi:hypothetical protein
VEASATAARDSGRVKVRSMIVAVGLGEWLGMLTYSHSFLVSTWTEEIHVPREFSETKHLNSLSL